MGEGQKGCERVYVEIRGGHGDLKGRGNITLPLNLNPSKWERFWWKKDKRQIWRSWDFFNQINGTTQGKRFINKTNTIN